MSPRSCLLTACLTGALLAGCDAGKDAEPAATQRVTTAEPERQPVAFAPAAILATGHPIGSISASETRVAVAFVGDEGPSCSPFLVWEAPSDAYGQVPTGLDCDGDHPVALEIELTRSSIVASSTYAPAFSAETAWGSVWLRPLDGKAGIELGSAFSTGEDGGTAIGALAADAAGDVAAFDVWRYRPASYDATFDGIVVSSRDGARRYTRPQLAAAVIALERTHLLIRREGGQLVGVDATGGAPRALGRFRGPLAVGAGRVAALRRGMLHVLETDTGKLVERERVSAPGEATLIAFDGRLLLYTRASTLRLRDVRTHRDVPARLADGVETVAELTPAGLFFVLGDDRVGFVPRARLLRAMVGGSTYPPPALVEAAP